MTEVANVNGVPEILNLPFPAATKQAVGMVNGVLTDVMSVSFSDKILVTISQRGRLGHWKLHVPMENVNPGTEGMHTIPNGTGDGNEQDDDSLLPLTNLTATSLLGGHTPGHEIINQLYARQIASAIAMKTPHEKRLLVLGLGLENSSEPDRDAFFAVVDLVLRCI